MCLLKRNKFSPRHSSSISINLVLQVLITILALASATTMQAYILLCTVVFSFIKWVDKIILNNSTLFCHIVTKILVNNGSDNGLLPYGTKPLPEPMLSQND